MIYKSIMSACILISTASSAIAADYAAWKAVNKDGAWTRAAEEAVSASVLPDLIPNDITTFCPNYADAPRDKRMQFWVGLESAMARPESNFKPGTTYLEPSITDANGKNVTSRGLLQISLESANQKAYNCAIKAAEDLHDPAVNIACATKILSYWVKKDAVISAQNKPSVGGARYWSVLRAWRNHLPEISTFTKSMTACSKSQ